MNDLGRESRALIAAARQGEGLRAADKHRIRGKSLSVWVPGLRSVRPSPQARPLPRPPARRFSEPLQLGCPGRRR